MDEKEDLSEMPEGPREMDRSPKEGYSEGWLKILLGTINMTMLFVYQKRFKGQHRDLFLPPKGFYQKYIVDEKR